MRPAAARAPRWKTILLLQLALWPACALAAEFAYRAYETARGTGHTSEELAAEMGRIASANEDFVPGPGQSPSKRDDFGQAPQWVRVIHPYVAFEQAGGSQMLERNLTIARRPMAFNVVVLGGSVAAAFANMGSGRLTALLESDPRLEGKKVQFLCFARGGYKEPQPVNWLIWLSSLGIEPDAVIVIHGFNEVALGFDNAESGLHPIEPPVMQWSVLLDAGLGDPIALQTLLDVRETQKELAALARTSAALGLHHSHLVARVVLAQMARLRGRAIDGLMRYHGQIRTTRMADLHGPWFDRDPERCIEAAVRNWTEASRSVAAICRARGIPCLRVLQPTLHDPDSKRLTEVELARGKSPLTYVRGVELGYPLLRTALRELASEDPGVLDASRLFAEVADTLYYDGCHFNELGNELLANAIAPALLHLLPAPVAETR
jgi:hypothetical protein